MSWVNRRERDRFLRELKRREKEYREAGMTEQQILAMREYDIAAFSSDRSYYTHTVSCDFYDDEMEETLAIEAFEQDDDGEKVQGNTEWYDTFENKYLIRAIKKLSQEEIDLLSLYLYEGYSQTEIGQLYNIPQYEISRRISNILELLRKTMEAERLADM